MGESVFVVSFLDGAAAISSWVQMSAGRGSWRWAGGPGRGGGAGYDWICLEESDGEIRLCFCRDCQGEVALSGPEMRFQCDFEGSRRFLPFRAFGPSADERGRFESRAGR